MLQSRLHKQGDCHHCAGLWEFPGTILPEGISKAERAAAVTACLQNCLQRLGCTEDILSRARRKPLGTVTHVFSHINMTLLVEHVILQVQPQANQAMLTSIWHFFLANLCPLILCLHSLTMRSCSPDLSKGKSAAFANWGKSALLRNQADHQQPALLPIQC